MYLVLMKRLKDLESVEKNNKTESSMLGSFRVFDKTQLNENLSDDELLEECDKLDPLFACYCLENSGEPTDLSNLDKPIIARTYTLSWSDTSCSVPKEYQNKHGARHAVLQLHNPNDKSFSDRKILIHIGNTAHDTLGCILLGKQADNRMIYKSTDAVREFFNLIKDKGVENFSLKIIDK
ncbi:DUF5675 family protein [Helicobacter cetorum]|uniref:DUF5675 family protein n=1 Tax=Helicobacter cetorum TaxID=138563 RepID=UPI000CF1131B|nr:DUF5675 family protein [Helicobacter cetorum]